MTDVSQKSRTSIPVRFTIALAILLTAGWAAFPSGAAAQSALGITSAYWDRDDDDSKLVVRGTGPARTTITIANAVTGAQLGTTRSERDGRWKLERELSKAPCSVRAAAAGQSATRTVSGAPSNCEGTPQPTVTLTGISIGGPAVIDERTGAQYTCTANYSDNSSRDVTTSASWSENSSSTSISRGYLTAESVYSDRTVTVSATFGGRSANYTVTVKNLVATTRTLSGLAVSGPSSVNEGATSAYTATASYSDGTSAPVTASWSENSSFASITAGGVLTAATVTANQTVTVTASYTEGGASRTANATVTIVNGADRILSGLSVAGPSSVNEGATSAYTATASYNDGTSGAVTATWSENSSFASITAGGVLTAATVTANQTVTVTASYIEGGASRTANATVTIVNGARILSGLAITGPSTLNEGATATYIASASYDDGTSAAVTATWNENSSFASISTGGVLTAATVTANQTVTVTAGYTEGGVSRTATTNVTIADGTVTGSHAGRFSSYVGSATCLPCHSTQALEVHGSVHYQWKGDASQALGLTPGPAGKMGGINDFCIYPDINWIGKLTNTAGVQVDGGCAKCHAGLGAKPDPNPTQAQLENIDCLICHSGTYKRTVSQVNGTFAFVPDAANMTVSILQAASDITLPNKDTCLNCHSKAGGGNNFKRGDIEEAHRNPARTFDVHMSSAAAGGAGLECLDCHVAANHKIAGRGTDLRERDSATPVACTNCHSTAPHSSADYNRHTARVNCTVCHIPTYAKVAATDMDRDWSKPGVLVPETGLYEPSHVKGTNQIPQYRFFNGKSYFYEFGDPAVVETNGRITLSEPDGRVTEAGAKIHAFKYHLGNQPIDPTTGRLLPLKVGPFFQTGQIQAAVEQGAAGVGWTYSGHQFARTERYLGLYHEVAPRENALTCNSCHNGGTRLDFDALGYAPNATRNGRALCSSCHGSESATFSSVHSRHVTNYGYNCSECHAFSRAQ